MSTHEVTVILWDNAQQIDPILKNHIVSVHPDTSTIRGADELLRECIFTLLDKHYESFIMYIFSIVGMEVEGQEVSLGLVLFKNDIPVNLSESFRHAKLGRWVSRQNGKLHLGMEGFADFRKIVRKLRSDLIGWVPGKFLEPVLILTGSKDATPYIRDIKILSAKVTATLTAHELYEDLTSQNSDCFVIWIKPAGSIRVYRQGKLFGQIMRLRDVGGWTTRHIDRMVEIVQHAARLAAMDIDENICRRWIVVPSVSISESRKGSTVVVMHEDAFKTLESNWKKSQVPVACKAKHAPWKAKDASGIDECLEDATEAEYENYLAQDGALVISPKGKLLGMGTYFRGGPGGRRDTAAWLPTKLDSCITVVTSQDGPIYLHWAVEEGGDKREEGIRLDFIPTSRSDPIQLEPKKEEQEVDPGLPDVT